MRSETPPLPASKKMHWLGWIISALCALMLIISAALKFAQPQAFVDGFNHLGYPERLALSLGILQIVCTVVYVVPQTAILGAILLTGYLGGATATHVRIGEPFFMSIVLGMLLWLGLFLRDKRLRALIPFRREPARSLLREAHESHSSVANSSE